MRTVFLLLGSLSLVGCGGGPSEVPADVSPSDSVAAMPATSDGIDLGPYDLPLRVTIPEKELTGGAETQLAWREEEGWFGVKVGDHFDLHITEAPGDIPRLKGDLERDLLRKHTIVKETPELVIYRSEYPDDPTLVSVNFYQVFGSSGRTFVIEGDPAGRFNEADVQRMCNAISAKGPV